MNKVYEIVTSKIVEMLEKGVIPWRKPWSAPGEPAMPVNLVTGRPYRGINAFLLHACGITPYWLTYRQAKQLGGNVKRGEHGVPVVYWNWIEKEVVDEDSGETKTKNIPFLRYYTVFNLSQTEGIKSPDPVTNTDFQPIAIAQSVIDGMPNPPSIRHGGNRAFYRPRTDEIVLPLPGAFDSEEYYYSVAFHELVHATGHPSRLNRKSIAKLSPFASTDYSKEELVAEMGAAFLCAHTGIEQKTLDNSAAYIQGWLESLRNDKRLVVSAAAQAQKAADFILGSKGDGHEAGLLSEHGA